MKHTQNVFTRGGLWLSVRASNTREIVQIGAFAAGAYLLSSGPAFAYLDPGTASMLFSALIAGALGGLVVIKSYWGNFKKRFKSLSGRDKDRRD